jgi:hypothetical protein
MPLLPLPAIFPFAGSTIAKVERFIPFQENYSHEPMVRRFDQVARFDVFNSNS